MEKMKFKKGSFLVFFLKKKTCVKIIVFLKTSNYTFFKVGHREAQKIN